MKLDFSSLDRSIAALRRSTDETVQVLSDMSPVLRETLKSGVIQHFEVAYEQCWKSMKRWLEHNGIREQVDGVTRRELFRLAAEHRLITDVDLWMTFHQGRNETSHTYDASTATEVYEIALRFLPEAERFFAGIRPRND